MDWIDCADQASAEAALKEGKPVRLVSGKFNLSISIGEAMLHVEAAADLSLEARGSSQPRVVARGSSQPRVVAWDSSQPRVEAWDSSQPRVEAWGSSQPRVEAWGSSQPRVEARGYAQLSIFGRVVARCAATVSVLIEGTRAKVSGGHKVRAKKSTAAEWCAYYGVAVKRGVAVLFKAVSDDFRTAQRHFEYRPGTAPSAPDWDGGKEECGGGLHFSPRPEMAREFDALATRFIACPVRLKDIVVHPEGQYPQKIKARGLCAPCWEVDIDGEIVEVK